MSFQGSVRNKGELLVAHPKNAIPKHRQNFGITERNTIIQPGNTLTTGTSDYSSSITWFDFELAEAAVFIMIYVCRCCVSLGYFLDHSSLPNVLSDVAILEAINLSLNRNFLDFFSVSESRYFFAHQILNHRQPK